VSQNNILYNVFHSLQQILHNILYSLRDQFCYSFVDGCNVGYMHFLWLIEDRKTKSTVLELLKLQKKSAKCIISVRLMLRTSEVISVPCMDVLKVYWKAFTEVSSPSSVTK